MATDERRLGYFLLARLRSIHKHHSPVRLWFIVSDQKRTRGSLCVVLDIEIRTQTVVIGRSASWKTSPALEGGSVAVVPRGKNAVSNHEPPKLSRRGRGFSRSAPNGTKRGEIGTVRGKRSVPCSPRGCRQSTALSMVRYHVLSRPARFSSGCRFRRNVFRWVNLGAVDSRNGDCIYFFFVCARVSGELRGEMFVELDLVEPACFSSSTAGTLPCTTKGGFILVFDTAHGRFAFGLQNPIPNFLSGLPLFLSRYLPT